MSRIHQAIRRAERELKESRPGPIIDSPASQGPQRLIEPPSAQPQRRNLSRSILRSPEGGLGLNNKVDPANWGLATLAPDPKVTVSSDSENEWSRHYLELKQKLVRMQEEQELKTVLVTSAAASEGKTLTAVNLALALCQDEGHKVLIIDANLRNPSVHAMLGFSGHKGLAQVLSQNLPLDEALLRSNVPGLYIMPAGGTSQDPAELLNTQKMLHLLAFAERYFDWVILDAPPVLPHADTDLLASFADGVLLVVHALNSTSDLVRESVMTLRGRPVLGVVLNGVTCGRKGR